ncbi:MAG: hypothetical protein M3N68_00925 [Actinomycetota bacterium]|nr:hypothetical protein [Actinomycetota bacterium]
MGSGRERATPDGPATVVAMDPLPARKLAQVVLTPDASSAAFAGVVHPEVPYGADARFWCPNGHDRIEPACACGFYAVDGDRPLPQSLVLAATCHVELAGRVVRHPDCLRGELLRVLRVVVDRWCAWCTGRATGLAPVTSSWRGLPPGWWRALPVCSVHAQRQEVVVRPGHLASLLATEVGWSDNPTSRAAASLSRAGMTPGRPARWRRVRT